MDHVIRVLLVDDDEDDYIMTRDYLNEIEERKYELKWIANYNDALNFLTNNGDDIDVCLFDYYLGEKTGLDLLKEVISSGCKIPIILLTGQGDREVDLQAMEAGAADYLSKSEITPQLLDRSIRYAIQHKRAEERILRMAYYDSLTNIPNRTLFNDRLRQAILHAERYRSRLAVMFLDIDDFKRVNDTLDHRIGDLLLQEVAERLSRYIRSSDTIARHGVTPQLNTVARLGGDEFTILLMEITSMETCAKVAQRILKIISHPFNIEGHEIFVSVSIGIAIYPEDGTDVDTLLKNADVAMYHAKAQGKNNYQFYRHSMNEKAIERMQIENDIRKGLKNREFELYYQPRVDVLKKTVNAVEALVRWNHPEKGLIMPNEFIQVAEETGLIIPLGEWVLEEACRTLSKWQKSDPDITVSVSVNISGRHFTQEGLVRIIEKIINDSGINPGTLEVEITESAIMKNAERTVDILRQLKRLGLTISMDDFGTGYSSFNYLKEFPIDIIKIDKTFIKDIPQKKEDMAIVRAIIAMSKSLGIRVIAEGVETIVQYEFLKQEGCYEMQGFLISRPLPEDQIFELLRSKDIEFLPALSTK